MARQNGGFGGYDMDIREQALLSAAVAFSLISAKARSQASRTTNDTARISLLETDGHCKTALRIIADARQKAVDALPRSTDFYVRKTHDDARACGVRKTLD